MSKLNRVFVLLSFTYVVIVITLLKWKIQIGQDELPEKGKNNALK